MAWYLTRIIILKGQWASYQIRNMRRECQERFPRHRLQRKPLVSDPGMHYGTCVTHVPWCMSGSLSRGGGENVFAFPAHAQPAILRIWQESLAWYLTGVLGAKMITGSFWCSTVYPTAILPRTTAIVYSSRGAQTLCMMEPFTLMSSRWDGWKSRQIKLIQHFETWAKRSPFVDIFTIILNVD